MISKSDLHRRRVHAVATSTGIMGLYLKICGLKRALNQWAKKTVHDGYGNIKSLSDSKY